MDPNKFTTLSKQELKSIARELLDKKAETNNTIDLNAYAIGMDELIDVLTNVDSEIETMGDLNNPEIISFTNAGRDFIVLDIAKTSSLIYVSNHIMDFVCWEGYSLRNITEEQIKDLELELITLPGCTNKYKNYKNNKGDVLFYNYATESLKSLIESFGYYMCPDTSDKQTDDKFLQNPYIFKLKKV